MFRGRGRGRDGRGTQRKVPLRGLFSDGLWYCNCDPRLPAQRFQTKNGGENHGRWFYTCQKSQPKRCGFFLWDEDAKSREAAAVLNNTRSEPVPAPRTPERPSIATGPGGYLTPTTDRSQRQKVSQRDPPHTPSKSSNAPLSSQIDSQRIDTTKSASDEEFYDWPVSDDEEILRVIDQASAFNAMPPPETPRKATKIDVTSTPGKRSLSEMEHGGKEVLLTPLSANSDDVFTTPSTNAVGSGLFATTPRFHMPADTPTPRRHSDAHSMGRDSELTSEVLQVLQSSGLSVPPDVRAELKAVCDRHSMATRGIVKGRDISRAMVHSKNEKIAELQKTIGGLRSERETDKAVIRHLRRINQQERTGKSTS